MKQVFGSFSLLLSLVFLQNFNSFAQEKYTVSGYVKDSSNGETFIGATITVKELPNTGAYTNNYGFYSLTLPKGNYTITYSYVGYASYVKPIELNKSTTLTIELPKKGITSKREAVITAERKDAQVTNTQMGKIDLSTEQLKTLPAIFGEVDVMKSIQLLPGVQSAGEGQTGFYVRGGGPDQNLILLDDAVVYNTGHLFGFFSVFNSDAIKNTSLIKGGMPANYGGRLSSVVDITMKEGNNKTYHATGGIGLIASRLTLEGPIQKGRSSFMISGRRTYIDVLTRPFVSNLANLKRFKGSGYYFYDLNLKANYRISDKDRLYLSGYFGRDVFNFKSPSGTFTINMPWGNQTAALRWNHLFTEKLFVNTSAIYNAYQFDISLAQSNFKLDLLSSIRDYNLKSDFDYYPNTKHKIKFGVNYSYHKFNPSAINAKIGELEIKPDTRFQKFTHEGAIYALDDYTITSKLKVNVGLRYVIYQQVGPYNDVTFDANRTPTDTVFYEKGKPVKLYAGLPGLEPRITLRYELNSVASIKAAYSHNNQFVHLVSNNGTTLPTDIWVPSTLLVKPQISDQYAVGYFRNFKDNMFETSVEVYYKKMQNQIEYREFYVPNQQTDVEKDFVFGKGESYGAEFFINKQYGKFTGWVGYTLAFTNRIFESINNGKKYPAKFDRRHDVNFVLSYELNDRWKFGGTWTYASGNVVTVPVSLYAIDGSLVQGFGPQNGFRLPAYHRADLSATWTPKHKTKKRVEGSWTFSVYNVYSRFNPYIIYLDTQGSVNGGDAKVSAKQIALFPIPLPSITWNFKF
jgi:TonB dependent receptor/CarboxypepD_reg-like domain/TonB-dependent Receptor Plug Domain